MRESKTVASLLKRQGVARSGELTRQGLSREQLRRLAARGDVAYAGRGLYLTPAVARSRDRDLLIAAKRVPRGVICLLSALSFHRLTAQMPHQVWIAIGPKARSPRLAIPPIRVIRMSEESLAAGVETHRTLGVPVRVFSVAKTVADCFKYRNKIGTDVAMEALREGWRRRRFTIDELWHFARICRVRTVIRPYLEALAG